jgi:hypothetical protein
MIRIGPDDFGRREFGGGAYGTDPPRRFYPAPPPSKRAGRWSARWAPGEGCAIGERRPRFRAVSPGRFTGRFIGAGGRAPVAMAPPRLGGMMAPGSRGPCRGPGRDRTGIATPTRRERAREFVSWFVSWQIWREKMLIYSRSGRTASPPQPSDFTYNL